MRLSRRASFFLPAAVVAAGCAATSTDEAAPATSEDQPLTIDKQGSFFVGGRQVTATGTYDEVSTPSPASRGQTYWIDQMYVHYQTPPDARRLPLVLVHGGSCTGASWESTPDGREGFQTIFVRRGYSVYTVDAPRGGRSGLPSFTGDFGKLDDEHQIIPPTTTRAGRELAWSRWRFGPRYPEVFADQSFPMEAIESFLKSIRPIASDDPEVVSSALIALLDRIGPAILVTHSNSGVWGWLTAGRSEHVKAIISYEPSFVFPENEMPDLPSTGRTAAATAVTPQEFARLAQIPVQVVFGDNIPTEPVRELPADGRRNQVIVADRFVETLNNKGGRASLLKLPDAGLRGNTHFPFSDRNNIQVADQVSAFLASSGVDGRN